MLQTAFARRKAQVTAYRSQLKSYVNDETAHEHYVKHIETSYIQALDTFQQLLSEKLTNTSIVNTQSVDALTTEAEQLAQFHEALLYRLERIKEMTKSLETELERIVDSKIVSRKAAQEEELATIERRIVEDREAAAEAYSSSEQALITIVQQDDTATENKTEFASQLERALLETKQQLYPSPVRVGGCSPITLPTFGEKENQEVVPEHPAPAAAPLYRRHSLVPRRELRKKTNRMFAKMFINS